ncbi:HET-domain-containing protein [Polychaeton citri CBS 116435]|uniref:HET-domain-containing protein n=1 Tax=Polychaeton citri CBS 116435 TaxID=1314669 RepID=A0A9P4QFB3_9PEZI|nr:HET-domain-containing protein [Polychaeton citri CBS 116435]
MADWLYSPEDLQQARLAANIYSPIPLNLDNDEIRLLKIQPSFRPRDEVSCTLQIISLRAYEQVYRKIGAVAMQRQATGRSMFPSEQAALASRNGALAYTALSYTWGTSSSDYRVTLNGKAGFRVTKNLHAALRRLRRQNAASYFWIDALCINQHDMDERSWQVKMMGRIYSLAERVLVWLGESEMDQMERKQSEGSLSEPMLRANSFPLDHAAQHGHTMSQQEALANAITRTRPLWWERAWVIQEFLMAQHDPVVQFGSYTLPWQSFMQMFKNAKGLQNDLTKFRNARSGARDKTQSILRFRDLAGSTSATDSRDKVYCFLSLIRPEEAALIEPDYHLPQAEVFARTTFAVFVANGSLAALAYIISRQQRDDSLPSWSVDFAFSGVEINYVGDDETYAGLVQILQAWKCRASSSPKLSLSSDARVLSINGCFLDAIVNTVVLSTNPSNWSNRNERLGHDLAPIFQKLDSKNPYHAIAAKSRVHAIARTASKVTWTRLIAEAQSLAYNYTWNLGDIVALFRLWKELCCPRHQCIDRDVEQRRLLDWAQYAYHAAGQVVLFTTISGFVGIGPGSIRTGDFVGLMDGSNAPVVLQYQQNDYAFRGLALIGGIMDGELSDLFSEFPLDHTKFDLR